MKRRAAILGIGSDIGEAMSVRLIRDGWVVYGYHHDNVVSYQENPWDLVVCCYGTLEPIGPFWSTPPDKWEEGFYANVLLPARHIRALYPYRQPGASVCFFSGAGTGGPAPTYSAYAASKAALIKMTELLDNESDDCKFFILGPGMVRTKIHDATVRADERAANIDRVLTFLETDEPGTSMDDIYACLRACHAAPKKWVGGRNIYVPNRDEWEDLSPLEYALPDMLKLRRKEPS